MNSEGAVVLVVDDEPRMVSMLQLALDAAGHRTLAAATADAAWDILSTAPVDLVVLDVLLPDSSGIELCRRVRETSDVPIILVTALGDTVDRVVGLEAGADDYIAKPFSPRELVLRVAAILRRSADRTRRPVVHTRRAAGRVVLDAALSLGRLGDRDLHLTPTEFKLLWLLAERPGGRSPSTCSPMRWGTTMRVDARAALRTAVYRVRGKLEEPGGGAEIESEHGRGYRLVISDHRFVRTITKP